MSRLLLVTSVLALAACSAQDASTLATAASQTTTGQSLLTRAQARATSLARTPEWELFCAVQLAGGGAIVAALIDAQAAATAPAAAPVAIIATGAAKSFVDAACAKAGGIPVSPPVDPDSAPRIAITS